MPGMAGAGGRPKKAKQVKKGKGGKRVSGNPAKAAAQKKAEQERAAAPADNPFGQPAPGEEVDYEKAAAALDLPKDFSKFLK
jgi:signal recognition particle subunit SRP54